MYVQITEKCNMTCDHCCFSATTKGDVMDRSVYMAALNMAVRYGDTVTIGGGEPTAHKEFFDYLDLAISRFDDGSLELPPFLVTNGKIKGKAHKLLDYVDDERSVHICLSQDAFHDPIDPSVVKRYKDYDAAANRARYSHSGGNSNSSASIRSAEYIMPVGRAVDMGVDTAPPPFFGSNSSWGQCCCEDAFVDPKGRVYSCGCKHTQLGMIWDDRVLDGFDREFAHQGGKDPECKENLEEEESERLAA